MSDDPTPEEFADPANWHTIEEHPYLNDPPNDFRASRTNWFAATSPIGKPMSDDLRTRIAAVLREHVEDQLTNYDAERNECGCGNQGLSGYANHFADAVIEALGLRLEAGRNVVWCSSGLTDKASRYVTEWTTDE